MKSLLRRETGLDVVCRETGVDRAIKRIEELHPDVVILDRADPVDDPTPAMMRIVRGWVGTKVIEMNFQDNTLGSIAVSKGWSRE